MRQSIERLRSLVFELRPAALDRDGLVVAIDQYLAHAAKETGWTYEVIDELDHEPDPELRVSLYRIVQEAVANARKHAGARHVIGAACAPSATASRCSSPTTAPGSTPTVWRRRCRATSGSRR